MKVALGFDHRGVRLRDAVLGAVTAAGHEALDLGVDTDAHRVDYPDTAKAVAGAILDGRAERGVLVCGSGAGVSIAASKIRGIRSAVCHDSYSAHQAVEHDDMNVLSLGSEIVGPDVPGKRPHGPCPVTAAGRCLLDLIAAEADHEHYSPREVRLLRRFAVWLKSAEPSRVRAIEVLLDDLMRAADEEPA